MGGGTTTQNQNANGSVGFNPTSIGGGNIMVGGSVGQGQIGQSTKGGASGAGVKLDLSMPMPMPALLNLVADNEVNFFRNQG